MPLLRSFLRAPAFPAFGPIKLICGIVSLSGALQSLNKQVRGSSLNYRGRAALNSEI